MENIYFIGIGGIAQSALARYLFSCGKNVSGSNDCENEITKKLVEEGISVKIGHDLNNLPPEVDLAIISPAILEDNIELVELKKRGVVAVTHGEALGGLTQQKYTIAVAGTHGKTTITSLIGTTLLAANFDPTIFVGTTLKELNSRNVHVGNSNYLVLEACEYKKTFLNYKIDLLVLSNIEMDHFDSYENFADYKNVFFELARNLPKSAVIVANIDCPNVAELASRIDRPVIKVGRNKNAADYTLHGEKMIYYKYDQLGELKLQLLGSHNRSNALLAFAALSYLNVPLEVILPNFQRFKGGTRRLEYRGKIGERTEIYDDYAHHPTAVKATISALKEKYPKERLCCVFQPHQHNRTKNLLKEYAKSFENCDEVLISDIYAARDTKEDMEKMTPEKLVKEISKNHPNVVFGSGLASTEEYLLKNAANFDLLLFMGAGNLNSIIANFEKRGILLP